MSRHLLCAGRVFQVSGGPLQSWMGSAPGVQMLPVCVPDGPRSHCDLIAGLLDENDLASLGSSSSLRGSATGQMLSQGNLSDGPACPALADEQENGPLSDAHSHCVRKLSPQRRLLEAGRACCFKTLPSCLCSPPVVSLIFVISQSFQIVS